MCRFYRKELGKVASFKLNLKALPFDSQSVNYRLDKHFFQGEMPTEIFDADVEVEMVVTRKSECDYVLSLTCSGTLSIPCDRCLDPMVHAVDTTYHLNIRQEGELYDDSRDTVLLVPESWRELDVEPLVRDTILLTIPIMHTHAPGECNAAMMAQLDEHHASLDEETESDNNDAAVDPRWDALRKLKNNN